MMAVKQNWWEDQVGGSGGGQDPPEDAEQWKKMMDQMSMRGTVPGFGYISADVRAVVNKVYGVRPSRDAATKQKLVLPIQAPGPPLRKPTELPLVFSTPSFFYLLHSTPHRVPRVVPPPLHAMAVPPPTGGPLPLPPPVPTGASNSSASTSTSSYSGPTTPSFFYLLHRTHKDPPVVQPPLHAMAVPPPGGPLPLPTPFLTDASTSSASTSTSSSSGSTFTAGTSSSARASPELPLATGPPVTTGDPAPAGPELPLATGPTGTDTPPVPLPAVLPQVPPPIVPPPQVLPLPPPPPGLPPVAIASGPPSVSKAMPNKRAGIKRLHGASSSSSGPPVVDLLQAPNTPPSDHDVGNSDDEAGHNGQPFPQLPPPPDFLPDNTQTHRSLGLNSHFLYE
jgi:hypothetical protein